MLIWTYYIRAKHIATYAVFFYESKHAVIHSMTSIFMDMLKKILCLVLMSSTQIFSQGLNDLSFGTDSTFDVVTWNIEWFPKNGTNTVDSVKKIITALDADLIGLQEIDDTALCRQMINDIPGYELFMDDDWFGGLAYVYKTNSITVQSIYKIYDTFRIGIRFQDLH